MKKILVIFFLLIGGYIYAQQGIFSKESDIFISGNDSIYINGDYANLDSNATSGYESLLFMQGHLLLTGNFYNYSNNVAFFGDSGFVHFVGFQDQYVYSLDTTIHFSGIILNKPSGYLYVKNNIYLKRELNFVNGNIMLHGGDIHLSIEGNDQVRGWLANEKETSRIYGDRGEEIILTQDEIGTENLRGMGIHFSNSLVGSSTTIKRGHVPLNSGDGSISKYFKVNTSAVSGVRMDYFNPDVDTLDENLLDVWRTDDGATWRRQFGFVDPIQDTSFKNFTSVLSSATLTLAEQNCKQIPYVEFGADTVYLCEGDSLTLNLQNQGLEHQWSTGETTQTITVGASGKYYGSALNLRGCTGSDTVIVIIKPNPIADFDFNDLVVCSSDSMYISDSSTIDSGFIANYNWDFGINDSISDTSNLQNPAYFYSNWGNYTVQLVTISDFGCTDTISKNKTIFPLPDINFAVSDTLCENVTVNFSDSTTVDTLGIIGRDWFFGDGKQDINNNSTNTSNFYTVDGSYSAILVVTSTAGCKDSLTQNISINKTPTASFTFDRQCSNKPISFINNSNLGYYHSWSFEDGDSSNTKDPQHLFPNHGLYNVELSVFSANGCFDDTIQTIYVDTIPNANFSVSDVCLGYPTTFTNQTSLKSGVINYEWDFNDGTNSTNENPIHSYINPSTFVVKLKSSNSYGCVDSTTKSVTIHPKPNTNFVVSNECFGFNINTTNTSNILSGTMTYNWGMGDGTIYSNTFETSHLYGNDTNYIIQLEAISDFGCKDTLEKNVTIHPNPYINFGDTIRTCSSYFDLDAENVGSSYFWSDNSSNQILHVSQNGTYTVEITTSYGCKFRDTVVVILNSSVSPNLGTDRNVCDNELLNAYQNGSTYLWSDNSNSSSITANNTGLYWVIVTDQNGCIGTDSVNLTVNSSPILNLGNDTTVCSYDSVLLDAQNLGSSYLWSSGETIQSIYGKNTGTYYVKVTNTDGCSTSDTIVLTFENSPILSLSDSIDYCGEGTLDAGTSSASYLWSTGNTTQFQTITTSGLYAVEGYSLNGCVSKDSSYVTILPVPDVNLGSDTALCNGNSLVFNITDGGSKIWSGGDTSSIHNVSSTGIHWLTITASNGCSSNDSIYVEIYPPKFIELGSDVSLCSNDALTFEANYTGKKEWYLNNSYLNNDSILVIDTTTVGKLKLVVVENGCVFEDSIQIVKPLVPLSAEFLIPSTVNVGDTVQIVQVSYPQPIQEYSWNLGNGVLSTVKHPSTIYYLPGDYEISLIVFNGNCYDTLKKTIHVLNMQIAVPEEPEEKEEIKIVKSKVYPNPTQGQITLEVLLNQSASLKVRMYDFNGRMVMFDNLNGLEIQKMMNLSSLKSGMYFIVLNTEDQQYTHKVILHPH